MSKEFTEEDQKALDDLMSRRQAADAKAEAEAKAARLAALEPIEDLVNELASDDLVEKLDHALKTVTDVDMLVRLQRIHTILTNDALTIRREIDNLRAAED